MIKIDRSSNFTEEQAQAMIGKRVAGVIASEYEIIIIFTDGSEFEARGAWHDGCALDTNYEQKPND